MIVADPCPMAVTSPVVETVAIDVLLLVHVTAGFAFAGVGVMVSCWVPPMLMDTVAGLINNAVGAG